MVSVTAVGGSSLRRWAGASGSQTLVSPRSLHSTAHRPRAVSKAAKPTSATYAAAPTVLWIRHGPRGRYSSPFLHTNVAHAQVEAHSSGRVASRVTFVCR